MPTVIDLRRAEDPRDIVHRAAQAVAEGLAIALPTETVYGLAASALHAEAASNLIQLKASGTADESKCEATGEFSLAIAVKSVDEAYDFMRTDSALAARFARRCWPGPVTLMVEFDPERSAVTRLPANVRDAVVSQSGHVALRVVAHPLVEQLQKYCAGPIVITSANRVGERPATTGADVTESFGDSVPLVLEDGATRYGGPSTVVRVTGNQFRIVREGVVESAAIRQYARPSIVVVCTGNTCRSPMAEVLLRKRVTDRFASTPGATIMPQVYSVGLSAMPGDPANPQAIEAMKERGLDLHDHESQPFGEQTLRSADLVLTMTRSHRSAILSRWPEAEDRVFTVRRDGGDISDPIGSPIEIYNACADQIDRELTDWVKSLGPEWLAVPETRQTEGSGDETTPSRDDTSPGEQQ